MTVEVGAAGSQAANHDIDLCNTEQVSAVAEHLGSTEEPAAPILVGEAPPSPAGPIEPGEAARPAAAAGGPAAPPAADAALQPAPDRVRLRRPPRARRRLPHARRAARTRTGDHQPPRPRALALHRQARAGALADRRVAAAADRRPQLGPHRASAPRHMRQRKLLLPPFHGEAIEHYTADDRRRRRTRDRPLAARPPLRPGAAHAGDHARRDHGRDLRHRGPARARHARAPPARARSSAWSPPRPRRSPRSAS